MMLPLLRLRLVVMCHDFGCHGALLTTNYYGVLFTNEAWKDNLFVCKAAYRNRTFNVRHSKITNQEKICLRKKPRYLFDLATFFFLMSDYLYPMKTVFVYLGIFVLEEILIIRGAKDIKNNIEVEHFAF